VPVLVKRVQDGLERPSVILAGAGAQREEATMQRTNLERLTDIVIGEAVTTLLSNAERINANALVANLKRMAAIESNPERLAAIKSALMEVQQEFPRTRDDATALGFATGMVAMKKSH